MTDVPRLVISAPSSGHGKTAVAVGLLAALTARELSASAFKIGPDYADAAYLGMACGKTGRNLDPRLTSHSLVPDLFVHGSAGSDIAVVEGALGLYDGISGVAGSQTTAQLAQHLRAPVVLVVDAALTGQSVAALVHGFKTYDSLVWLAGVILTRVASDRHEEVLRQALDRIDVPVLGALRKSDLVSLPPRHHGMVPTADRAPEAVRAVRRLGETILDTVDIDRLLSMARSAPRLSATPWDPADVLATAGHTPRPGPKPLVAVAGGSFFTYSYTENIELLQAAGADIAVVDPLRDTKLPDGAQGLVFGGGFPEWYVEELAGNVDMERDMAALANAGAPIAAESAGLVWLAEELDGRPMGAVLAAAAKSTDQTVLGYRDATAYSTSVLMRAGETITGHQHHRTVVSPRAGDHPAWSWLGGRTEGYVERGVHASYLNLNWAALPVMASRFVGRVLRS
ncbi:cobyrinate a,c-diamide synthase [Stackebrandtia soli]|uniref:cobyrinate a,c-diamide synthase n=1 Tax=Stackebrandtia soli TaxID=1892856 RepID=UPI0039E73855